MRDPARIDRITTTVNTLWHGFPDQGLGQLLSNYAFAEREGYLLFQTEDDLVAARLEEALTRTQI